MTLSLPLRIYKFILLNFFFAYQAVLGAISVAKLALQPSLTHRSRFVRVPLDVKSDVGIWMLACLVSLTPGSVSITVEEDKSTLLVHSVLSVSDEEVIVDVKSGFERRIMEVFQ